MTHSSPHNTNHMYNTRHGNQLRIPQHNTNIIKYTVNLAGPKIWNSITTYIQNISPVMFKQNVKAVLIGEIVLIGEVIGEIVFIGEIKYTK